MSSHTDRVVVLVDMDCFYCQVEEKLNPNLAGKPIAVVQYNAWRGGGIIAVNYPARDRGVTRHMRGNEAKKKCPEIVLVRVPNIRGKADLNKYREAGKRVAEVLQTFTPLLQRASVDEAYLDITAAVNTKISTMPSKLTLDMLPNTHVVGCGTEDFVYNAYNNFGDDSNVKLAVGGAIVEEIRAAVYEKTGYRCSAGIAHNKILAKLACGLHKPNKQTILPQDGVEELYESLPLKKITSLGGKFGSALAAELNITNMGELLKFTEHELLRKYDEKTTSWLYNIARGIDNEPVEVRLIAKSIGCSKKFPGKSALKTTQDVTHWLSELSAEIAERLEQDLDENNRRARQLTISFAQEIDRRDVHGTRTLNLSSYEAPRIASESFEMLKKLTQKADGSFRLKFLGLSAGKFEDRRKSVAAISSFFKPVDKNSVQSVSSRTRLSTKANNLTNFFKTSSVNSGNKCDENKLENLNLHRDNRKCDESRFTETPKNNNNYDKIENMCTVEEDRKYDNLGVEEVTRKSSNNYDNKENICTIVADTQNDSLEVKENSDKSFIRKFLAKTKSLEKNVGNSKGNQNVDEINDEFLHLSQIEQDTDINMDESLRHIEELHKSIYEDENPYLNTTIEIDYSEKLKTKLEFPNFPDTERNNIFIENTSSSFSDSCSEITSPIMNRTEYGDTSKSFFMRYAKRIDNVKKKLAHQNSVDNESNPMFDHEKPGCSYQQAGSSKTLTPTIYDSDISDMCNDSESSQNGKTIENNNTSTDDIHSSENINRNYFNLQAIVSENSNSTSAWSEMLKTCPVCSEKVHKHDYITHMDHHIAMQLMAEEKQLFHEQLKLEKQRNPVKAAVSAAAVKINKTKATKRKSSVLEKNNNCSIASFFTAENRVNGPENTEQCPECGRRIVKSELECHLDFHAAKKLHLELNSDSTVVQEAGNAVKVESKLVKSRKKNVNSSHSTISSFFKPIDK